MLDVKTAEDFYELLRRLYGDTYGSRDEDSVFQRQLRAWGVLLALGRSEIDRAFRQAFPTLSDALIDGWERVYRFPNDSARTLAQRQARLAAHERTQQGATRSGLQNALDATETTAAFSATRRDEVLLAGSEPAAIYQTTLQLANEDFWDPIVRSAIETIFGNALNAKNVGALSRLGHGHSTCVEVGARWGSSEHFVGRDALVRQVAVEREERGAYARVRSYGPGSRIDAADLNAMQETAVATGLDGERGLHHFEPLQVPGLITRWFGAQLTDTALVLDRRIDWRDRMVWVCATESQSVDLRPGESGDNTYGTLTSTPVWLYAYTGPGDYRGHSADTSGAYWSIYASTDGELMLQASTGETFNVVGAIWATEKLGHF